MLEGLLQRDRWMRVAPQHVPRSKIADRQREAIPPILEAKLPLVVGCPPVPAPQVQANIVRPLWDALWTAGVRPAGVLVKAALAVLLEPVDPIIGCGSGDPKPFGEFSYLVVVQLVVFEESLSLFAHGDTSPGHGAPPPRGKCQPCP